MNSVPRLLVVDDRPDNLLVLQGLIPKAVPGCEVVTAQSADEGLALAAGADVDAAIVDVQMPGVNGIEMCRQLKSDESTEHIPVVLITSHESTSELRAEGLDAGADDFISRPIDNVELAARIKGMLRIRRVEDELRDLNQDLEHQVEQRTSDLRRIRWLLTRDTSTRPRQGDLHEPSYGDLTELNTCRVILDSVGRETLRSIAHDYLDLLETSSVIYERNGDYALGIFGSAWCRFLDEASHRLCHVDDNAQALACGKWHCHESCRTEVSTETIERGQPVDRECNGGIRLYGIPIRAGGEIVGAISFGYGDPPEDAGKLREIAVRYGVSVEELRDRADAYESRPRFIIDAAKRRLETSAKLIGEMVARAQAQQRLQESEERMRLALEGTDEGLWDWDMASGAITFGENWPRVLGYTPGEREFDFAWWESRVHPDSLPVFEAALSAYLEGRAKYYELEYQLRVKSGEWRWIWARGVCVERDDQGEPLRMIGTHRDITERKQARDELQALLRLHGSTLATIPSSLLVLDAGLNVLMANQRYLNARGAQASDVVGRHIDEVLPLSLLGEDSLRDRMRVIAEKGGQDELLGVSHTSQDHDERHLNIRICGVRAPEDREGGARLVLVLEDVTEQRVLERQVRQAAKMEAVGRLAGGVAHDFNNLLTGITGYTQLRLRELAAGSPMHEDLSEVMALTKRAAALTRQLLTFSRRQEFHPVPLSINSLISNLMNMLGRLIAEDIDLAFRPADDLGTVRADAGQIEQIVVNLAVNARDAMPNGGKLTIETGNALLDRDYAARHVVVEPGPYVMLAVADTGNGMDATTQEHIFEPFFTTKEEGKGTGLGLSTVYGIVKQHGGNVWVYSELGQGTTFKVYLPRVDVEAEELAAPAEERPAPRGSETILVVEDDEAVRGIVPRTLGAYGYTVLCAADANEGEALFEQRGDEVALLLTDVVMPGRSGRELCEQLVAKRPELKVLYMSGYTDDAIVHHGVLDPGTPFISKPFDPDDLARKVREVLGG